MLFCVVSGGCLTVELLQVAGLSQKLRDYVLSRTHANAFFLEIFQGLRIEPFYVLFKSCLCTRETLQFY
jgi:hypothetical protein